MNLIIKSEYPVNDYIISRMINEFKKDSESYPDVNGLSKFEPFEETFFDCKFFFFLVEFKI